MPQAFLSVLSEHLAKKLSEIGQVSITKLAQKWRDAIANILEAKLMTYRGFEPLCSLVKQVCPASNLIWVRSAYAEKAGLTGQGGRTRLIQVKSTLVNWQSVSDAGRDHKKKELCGRAVGLRYSWDAKSKQFIPRPGIKKLILVVDGTWTQENLNALARSGWDEIFYPDEMDKLAKTIV
jgi:hypothetical protein